MIKFDVDKLKEIIEKIHILTKVKICIFDLDGNEIIFYPNKYSKFCALVRSDKKGNEKCILADKERINKVIETKNIVRSSCPHGLDEIFAPIIVNDDVVAIICLAQFKFSSFSIKEVLSKVEYLNLSEDVVKNSLDDITLIQEEHLDAIYFLVDICSKYVHYEQAIHVLTDSFMKKIETYIDENINEKITAETLCSTFYVSKATLYNGFRKYFNSTVANFIRDKKLAIAKKMIQENPSIQIGEISYKISIDPNYFPKIFKKKYGISPKKFQKGVNYEKI